MPKKTKRSRSKGPAGRPAAVEKTQPRPKPAAKMQPGTIWHRFKSNPMAIMGAIVVTAMIVTMGIGIFEAGQPRPTPTAMPSVPSPSLRQVPTVAVTGTPVARKTYTSRPPMTIDVNKVYTATIVTDKGEMVFRLFPQLAPVTVNSFVFLAREGFYDGLTFHRVEPGFVIQGGDPKGDGTGGPGYTLPAEFNPTKHITGTLAMARAQDPDSAGSQFYITLAPQPHLDNQYTVFGQIASGMEVAYKIVRGDVIRRIIIEEK